MHKLTANMCENNRLMTSANKLAFSSSWWLLRAKFRSLCETRSIICLVIVAIIVINIMISFTVIFSVITIQSWKKGYRNVNVHWIFSMATKKISRTTTNQIRNKHAMLLSHFRGKRNCTIFHWINLFINFAISQNPLIAIPPWLTSNDTDVK